MNTLRFLLLASLTSALGAGCIVDSGQVSDESSEPGVGETAQAIEHAPICPDLPYTLYTLDGCVHYGVRQCTPNFGAIDGPRCNCVFEEYRVDCPDGAGGVGNGGGGIGGLGQKF